MVWRSVVTRKSSGSTNVKVNGKMMPVLVQAFDRRVLTYTPDDPIVFRVEYGNIGRGYNAWRYPPPA